MLIAKGFGRLCCALALGASLHVSAQVPDVQAPVELKFDVSRYVVDGNSILAPAEIEAVLAPFAGREFGFTPDLNTLPIQVPPEQGMRVTLPRQALNLNMQGGSVGRGDLECAIP